MRRISPHARTLRRDMTEAEKRLWSHLRGRRMHGCKFRRQWTIGAFIADFACTELKLVIEVDGGQHSQSEYDVRRTRWLESQGWQVVRFWNGDVLGNLPGVLEIISDSVGPWPSSNREPSSGGGPSSNSRPSSNSI